MHKLTIVHTAERDLLRLPRDVYKKALIKISSLKQIPQPHGCRKINGAENSWRIRVGDYRIVYEIDDDDREIIILRIKHRKDSYR